MPANLLHCLAFLNFSYSIALFYVRCQYCHWPEVRQRRRFWNGTQSELCMIGR